MYIYIGEGSSQDYCSWCCPGNPTSWVGLDPPLRSCPMGPLRHLLDPCPAPPSSRSWRIAPTAGSPVLLLPSRMMCLLCPLSRMVPLPSGMQRLPSPPSRMVPSRHPPSRMVPSRQPQAPLAAKSAPTSPRLGKYRSQTGRQPGPSFSSYMCAVPTAIIFHV